MSSSGLLLNHVHHVVHGNHADQAPGSADHRRRDEVVLLEDVADLLLVGLGGNRLEIGRHDVAQQQHRASGTQQPVQGNPPDRPVARGR